MTTQLEDEKGDKLVKNSDNEVSSSGDHVIQYLKPFPGYWDFFYMYREQARRRES